MSAYSHDQLDGAPVLRLHARKQFLLRHSASWDPDGLRAVLRDGEAVIIDGASRRILG